MEALDSAPGEADTLQALRPFYGLCWVTWGAAVAVIAAIAGNGFARATPEDEQAVIRGWQPLPLMVALGVAGAVLLLLFAIARWQNARAQRLAQVDVSPRLERRLRPLREALGRFIGRSADAVEIAITPDQGSVMWTIATGDKGGAPARVAMTAGFWAEERSEEDTQVALAHEAGHIAARDVEQFHRLWAAMIALSTIAVPVLVVMPLRLVLRGNLVRVPSLGVFIVAVASAMLGVLLAWSALLIAREIQADAFAATRLDPGAVRDFLRGRAALRSGERLTVWSRLYRWLVQPSALWRAELPAARSELGGRIEMQLGIGLVVALITGCWAVVLMTRVEVLGGVELPCLVLMVGYLLWLAFQFGWWRTEALVCHGERWSRWALTWGRFVLPAAVVLEINVAVLQWLSDGHLGQRVPGLSAVRANVIFLAGFLAIGATVAGAAAIAHGVDQRARRTRPSLGSAMASALAAGICAAILGIAGGRVAERVVGQGGFVLGVALCVPLGLWSLSLVFTRRANALRRRSHS